MEILSNPYLVLALSIFALFYGAGKLVNGSVQIATKLGIPSAIVGLTIVALGTSTPEIFSSISAQMYDGEGKGNIALGNVVGSNLCNIGLILGVSALIMPIPIAKVFTKREMPVMLFVSFLLYYLIGDSLISKSDGLLLFTFFLIYTVYLIIVVRKDKANAPIIEEIEIEKPNFGKAIFFIVLGMVLLGLGGKYIISSSITVCTNLGMSEKVVGLIMVAFGTSCPELAASLVASLKKESDILVGNIVGSNALNIMIVCGITPLVKPVVFDLASMRIDLYVMLGLSVLLFVLSLHKSYFHRWKGALVLALYLIYTYNTIYPFYVI